MPNKYENKTESVRGNPTEITAVNDKTSQQDIFLDFDGTRKDFKSKYGVDPTSSGLNASPKKIRENSQALATQVKASGPEAQQEFQSDFKKLKEGYKEQFNVKEKDQYNRSNIGKYEKELIDKGALEPEKEVAKELTKREKEWEKTKKGMAAGMGELFEKLSKMEKAEATHETVGGTEKGKETTATEKYNEYTDINKAMKDKYGVNFDKNRKATPGQLNNKIIPKLKEALEPEGSSVEEIQQNKQEFRDDLSKYKEAFATQYGKPNSLSTISKLEKSDYLKETREKEPGIPAKVAEKKSKTALSLGGASQEQSSSSTFAKTSDQSQKQR